MNKEVIKTTKWTGRMALLFLVLCVGLLGKGLDAKAAQNLSVPVKVSMTATEAKDVSFTVKLLEQVSGASAKTLTLKHGQEKNFTLSFSEADVGVHTYTIRQVVGSNASISYDTSLYWLQVEVEEGADGSLEATSKLWQDGATGKASEAAFVNTVSSGSGSGGSGDGSGSSGSDKEDPGSGSDGSGSDGSGSDGSGSDGSGSGSGGSGSGSGSTGSGSGSTGSGPTGSTGAGSSDGTGAGSGAGTSGSSASFWSSLWGSGSTTSSTTSTATNGVRTGDGTPTTTYVLLLFLSALLILAALLVSKRRNVTQNNYHRKDRVHD